MQSNPRQFWILDSLSMELGFQTLSRAFSTFDMNQLAKTCRNHWKKRLKISKLAKLESGKVGKWYILSKRRYSSAQKIYKTQTCPPPPPITQRPVNFRKFAEPYLPTLKTYHPKTSLRIPSGVDGFSPTYPCKSWQSETADATSLNRAI